MTVGARCCCCCCRPLPRPPAPPPLAAGTTWIVTVDPILHSKSARLDSLGQRHTCSLDSKRRTATPCASTPPPRFPMPRLLPRCETKEYASGPRSKSRSDFAASECAVAGVERWTSKLSMDRTKEIACEEMLRPPGSRRAHAHRTATSPSAGGASSSDESRSTCSSRGGALFCVITMMNSSRSTVPSPLRSQRSATMSMSASVSSASPDKAWPRRATRPPSCTRSATLKSRSGSAGASSMRQ